MSDTSLTEEFRVRTPKDGEWLLTASEIRSGLADGSMKHEWPARRQKSREWSTLRELCLWIESEEVRRAKRAKELLAQNPPTDALCRVRTDGTESGPFLPEQIRKMWDAGQIKADAICTFDGLEEWFPVRNMLVRATVVPGPGGAKQKRSPLAIALFAVAVAAIVFVKIQPDKRTTKADNLLFVSPEDSATLFRGVTEDSGGGAYSNAANSGHSPQATTVLRDLAMQQYKFALERETQALCNRQRAFRLESGTGVEVLGEETDSEGNSLRKVKVLTGSEAGAIGYVITQALK